MDKKLYKLVYSEIEKSNIEEIAAKYGIREEILLSILNLKLVRQNKKVYAELRNSGLILDLWNKGESIPQISSKVGLSPVLTSLLLMRKMEYSKREARANIKNPWKIRDPRLREEVAKAIEVDFLYSPWAHVLQRKRAKLGEEILREWLEEKGASFALKKDRKKTPDFVFEKPLTISERDTWWADSKAIFADESEHRRYISKQFADYLDIFGPGLVVYWYGCVDTVPYIEPDIVVLDYSSITHPKVEELLDSIK
jgi:hypothetical protein